jgi:hypothetical protein
MKRSVAFFSAVIVGAAAGHGHAHAATALGSVGRVAATANHSPVNAGKTSSSGAPKDTCAQSDLGPRVAAVCADLKKQMWQVEQVKNEEPDSSGSSEAGWAAMVWFWLTTPKEDKEFIFHSPDISFRQNAIVLQVPEVKMVERVSIFHTPAVRMVEKTREFGVPWCDFRGCGVRQDKVIWHEPETYLQENKVVFHEPQFSLREQRWVLNVPDVTMREQRIVLTIPVGGEPSKDAKAKADGRRAKIAAVTAGLDQYGCRFFNAFLGDAGDRLAAVTRQIDLVSSEQRKAAEAKIADLSSFGKALTELRQVKQTMTLQISAMRQQRPATCSAPESSSKSA